jgi:hypothetical protein
MLFVVEQVLYKAQGDECVFLGKTAYSERHTLISWLIIPDQKRAP